MSATHCLDRATRTASARCAATLASAVLVALPLARDGPAALAIVSLIPFLSATRSGGALESVALGALFGVVLGALMAPWLPEALRSLGSSELSSRAGLAVAAAWAGPPVFVIVAGCSRLARRASPATRALALAAAVFAAEWGVERAWWGVPTALLGHSQRDTPGIAQLAVVGGVPLLSAWLVALNAAWADALAGSRRARRPALALAFAWAAQYLGGLPLAEALRPTPIAKEPVELLLVQPDLPRGERWGEDLQALNLHRVRAFSERALAAEAPGIDALLLPENLSTSPVDARPELAARLAAWVDALGVPVLTGLVLAADPPAPDRYRSAAVWLEPGRGMTARVDKARAVPVLESSRALPGGALLTALLGDAARWPKVEERPDVGSLPGPFALTPLLCFEAFFPELAATRRAPGSLALVLLADDAWVSRPGARRRLAGLARFRAIEARSTLIRVAHGGLSGVFDSYGRTLATLPLETWATLRVRVRAEPPVAHRERVGLALLPALAFTAAFWSSRALARLSAARAPSAARAGCRDRSRSR